ncbi:TTAGGG repeat binding factor [Pyricularia oryzae]
MAEMSLGTEADVAAAAAAPDSAPTPAPAPASHDPTSSDNQVKFEESTLDALAAIGTCLDFDTVKACADHYTPKRRRDSEEEATDGGDEKRVKTEHNSLSIQDIPAVASASPQPMPPPIASPPTVAPASATPQPSVPPQTAQDTSALGPDSKEIAAPQLATSQTPAATELPAPQQHIAQPAPQAQTAPPEQLSIQQQLQLQLQQIQQISQPTPSPAPAAPAAPQPSHQPVVTQSSGQPPPAQQHVVAEPANIPAAPLPHTQPLAALQHAVHESTHVPAAQLPSAQPVAAPHQVAAEPAAPSWDLAALLESALGDIDEQAFKTLQQPEPNVVPARAPEPAPPVPAMPVAQQLPRPVAPVVRPKQKRMKFHENPIYIVRSMGLHFLGSLAVQVLLALSERPRVETVNAIRSSDSETGKAYKSLSAAFKAARRMFSETSSILQADELKIEEPGDFETIQMANLATICSTVFESDTASLLEAHNGFLRTFLPELSPLTDNLTNLFLSLKTQAFLRSCPETADDARMRELLGIYFPADAEAPLKQLHPDSPLTQTEKVFMSMSTKRGERLGNEVRDTMKRKLLAIEYPWDGLLDDLNKYLRDNLDNVLTYAESQGIEIPADEESIPEPQIDIASGIDLSALHAAVHGTDPAKNGISEADKAVMASDSLGLGKLIQATMDKDKAAETESLGLASLINERMGAHAASQTYQQHPQAGLTYNGNMHNTYLSQPQYHNGPYQQQYAQAPAPGGSADLPPNQSSPSTVLYERARQAAVAKSTVSNTRRDGLSSTRRPWSPEEERALMTGLDLVKGPHWSQILSLFGPNGTLSDVLKDRSQVQLKDKARNLKLFFLKTNSEMPYYLQSVTGELKTRAPNLSARKAREMEQAGVNAATEEQARAQGMAGLAHDSKTASPAPPPCSPLTPGGSVNGGRTGSPSTPLQTHAKIPIPPATSAAGGSSMLAHAPQGTNGIHGPRPGVASTIGQMSPHVIAAQARTAAATGSVQPQAQYSHVQTQAYQSQPQQGAQIQQHLPPRAQNQAQHQRPLPAQIPAAQQRNIPPNAQPGTQQPLAQGPHQAQQLPGQTPLQYAQAQVQAHNAAQKTAPRVPATQGQTSAATGQQNMASSASRPVQHGQAVPQNYPQKPLHPAPQSMLQQPTQQAQRPTTQGNVLAQQQPQQHAQQQPSQTVPRPQQQQQAPTTWQVQGQPQSTPSNPGQQAPRPPINGLQPQTAIPAYLQGSPRPAQQSPLTLPQVQKATPPPHTTQAAPPQQTTTVANPEPAPAPAATSAEVTASDKTTSLDEDFMQKMAAALAKATG